MSNVFGKNSSDKNMSNKNILDKNRAVFLIDGSFLLYRGYYGMQPLHTSQGVPVQAVYTFCRTIKRLITLFDPEYMAIVWDSKGKTIRQEIYPAYKATRQAPPSDLFTQKEYCIEFADLIGIKQVAIEGIEADDLLFSIVKDLTSTQELTENSVQELESAQELASTRELSGAQVGARELTENRDKIVLVTADKDLGQLITDDVMLYDPLKDIVYGVDNFTEKLGFPIAKLSFYFALLGDASDNIPGVHGIGKKTALELVNQFDSLEDVYAHLDALSSKRARTALEGQRDNAFLSQDLFLLRYYETDIKKQDIIFNKDNWQKAESLFKKLEFNSLLRDLAKNQEQNQGPLKIDNKNFLDKENVDKENVDKESSGKENLSRKDLGIENLGKQSAGQKKSGIQDSGIADIENLKNNIEILKKWDFRLVSTEKELLELCELLKKSTGFAFDTETTGLNALAVDLVGISFSVKEGQAFYIACAQDSNKQELSQELLEDRNKNQESSDQELSQEKLSQQLSVFAATNQELDSSQKLSQQLLPINTVISHLKPIFIDSFIEKYAHNSKYDKLVLSRYGIEVCGPLFDTYIAASLVTKSWQSAGLKSLSMHYFNEPMLSYDQIMSTGPYKNFSEVPTDLAVIYAASDAHQTLRLVSILKEELEKQSLMSFFETIETPLIQILYEMERVGIILDVDVLKKVNNRVTLELDELKETIFAVTESPINLNSSKQVAQLLFVTLGLTPPKKTSKGGSYSTDYEVLVELAKNHVVPGLLLKYRELAKLKSTYLDALPSYINKYTGRIHTSFSQARVATGRLSSSDPNMQNIPNNGYGIAIREAFKPQEDYSFISADYSQIELRVLAHLSQDPSLVYAFKTGQDIHMQTAARLFDVAFEQVSHEQRQMGKRINFSILYGLTPYGLSKDLNIPFKEAKIFIEKYFDQYPGVLSWMDSVVEFAKEHGYVETFWGRRRDIPGIYEKNNTMYQEAKRVAINTVAQGTAAEIMKQGMINVRNALYSKKLEAHLVLQIHDELLVSAKSDQAQEVEACVIQVLDSVVSWSVPFLVSTRMGPDWRAVSK